MEVIIPWLCCCMKLCRKRLNQDDYLALLKSESIGDFEMDLDDEQLLNDAKKTDKKLDDIIQECGAEPYIGDNLLAFKEYQLKNSVLKNSRNTLSMGSLSGSQKIFKT